MRFSRGYLEVKRAITLFTVGLTLIFSNNVLAEEALLPRPKELEPDIRFWTRVYTEITTDQGFIHDDRYLGIVYTIVDLEPGISRRERNRFVNKVKDRYKDILLSLARESHKNLSEEERRVLELWPKNISREELREAAQHLRFQLGQSNKFKEGLVRSGRWMPHILATLREMGLPEELACLPHVESSFNPSAYSFIGAAGMWQFTRSTGRRFMRVDHVIDERLDPFASSVAAAKLLQHNYSTTGTWPLAITAYNHGAAGMRRAVEETGGTDIVKILRQYKGRAFKFASRNFYVAFLAAVDVQKNAEQYFGVLTPDSPDGSLTVELPAYIPALSLAQTLGLEVDILKHLNPALRPPVWAGEKYIPRGFEVRVPGTVAQDLSQLIATVPQKFHRQLPDLTYKVRRGDSLSAIADRFGVGVRDLMAMNNLRSRHFIRAGQVLKLPQKATGIVEMQLDQGVYTVKRGDSLSLIAGNFGISPQHLMALNDLRDPHRIHVGQQLRISESAEPVQPPAPEVVASAKPAAEDTPEEISSGAPAEPVIAPVIAEVSSLVEDKLETSEPVSEAEEMTPVQPAGLHPPLAADPSDYSVDDDNTVEVLAAETLGHYADWLGLATQRLRNINGLRFGEPLVIGKRLKLDFSRIDREAFEHRRTAYHRSLQEAYFSQYQIAATEKYKVRRGDSIWDLTRRNGLPLWLLLQYNPDLDLNRVNPGTELVIPQVSVKEQT
ncbi:MAG TPA: LysM peptidoglycan-binding domain-containing protein [Gammaproteobacteria bacterium]